MSSSASGPSAERRAGLALALAALCAVVFPPSSPASEVVRSGPLRAEITPDPWGITFRGPAGRTLDQPPPGGVGDQGNLAFRSVTGWAHAVRATSLAREGRGVRASVATDDPLGRTLEVTVAPAGHGSIRVSSELAGPSAGVLSSSISFLAQPAERFFGFGERSHAVDHRGLDVENYVADGPFPERARPFTFLLGLPWAERMRDDSTYYPVPWALSSRGFGALIENDETSTFHLASDRPGVWSAEPETAELSVRVFAGRTPAAALRRFTAATGRQPRPQAPWAYGPWFQTGQPNVIPIEDEREWVRLLRDGDAPVSVAETQMHYLPCGAHRADPAYDARRTRHFHRQGLARLSYFNPLICTEYEPVYSQAAAAGALQRQPVTGDPFTYPAYVGGDPPLGFTLKPLAQFDFTSAAGREIYRSLLDEGVADGIDGWMEDFGEYTPPLAESSDGTPGSRMHNRYPTTFHCMVRDYQAARDRRPDDRPLVRFSRSGWTGTAACADNVWGGDPTTVFGYDGLASAVRQGLTMGASGISRWGSDIGGYHTFGPDQELTPELLARWIEFGAVSGVMRTKASGFELPPYERPQIWEPETIEIWRRYAKLHTQLNPYLRAADARYRRSGLPIMRQHALTHPRDPVAGGLDDQFLFGPNLLAAPVLEAGARSRSVYVPGGRWFDFWRSIHYRASDGSFHVGRAVAVPSRERIELKAGLGKLPLLVRAGALIPMLPADVDTLASYGSKPGLVHLDDRAGRMRLLAFPRGTSRAGMNEAERLVAAELAGGGFELAVDGRRARLYSLEAALGALRHRFRPATVLVDGRPLRARAWGLAAGRAVLRARFRCRDCTLTVLPAGG